MTPSDLNLRFEDLCAGLALGDLSAEESRELDALSQQLGRVPITDFNLLAATLEIDAIEAAGEPMPSSLSSRLHEWAETTCIKPVDLVSPAAINHPPAMGEVIHPMVPAWKKILTHPAAGWAAAAAAIVISIKIPKDQTTQVPGTTQIILTPSQAESRLRNEATDLIERDFAGLGDFAKAGGKVIWSNQKQEGYMILNGIPINTPSVAQYQLWIVDPQRDADSPVDGGVFDIPSDGSPVIVPINAKLSLSDPKAFLITLEKSGGVVKSKREKEVALAKI